MDTRDDELMALELDRVTLSRNHYLPLYELRTLAERIAGNEKERAAVKPLLEAMVTRDAVYCVAVLREIREAFAPQRGMRWFPRLNSLVWDVDVLIEAIETDILNENVRAADDCEGRYA